MSSSSDSEEFYDARDDINVLQSQRRNSKLSRESSISHKANSEPNICKVVNDEQKRLRIISSIKQEENEDVTNSNSGGGRKRFKELRKKLQNDEEEGGQASCITPPDSQTSSVEGIFATNNRTSHPFRIIEHDALSLQSINSLGRIGRILGGLVDNTAGAGNTKEIQIGTSASTLSTSSESASSSKNASPYQNNLPCLSGNAQQLLQEPEPDVVASTKSSKIDPKKEMPIAPPRKKKKTDRSGFSKHVTKELSNNDDSNVDVIVPTVSNAVESLTKSLEECLEKIPAAAAANGNVKMSFLNSDKISISSQSSKASTLKSCHSLDLRQAIKGQYVVKPQDDDKFKAAKSSKEEILRLTTTSAQSYDYYDVNDYDDDRKKKEDYKRNVSRGSVGHNSLGSSHRESLRRAMEECIIRERRKSAGDEKLLQQINVCVRTRTDSGKQLTDREILEQVTVLNLDTGERVPLSVAEEKLPQGINPLSLHIMRLTSEYVSNSNLDIKQKESDEESVGSKKSEVPMGEDLETDVVGSRVSRKRTAKIKRFLGSTVKKTMHKAKSIAQEVSHARHKEDVLDIIDEVNPGEQNIKLKASNSHKGPYELENIQHVQEIKDEHQGAIWCMKFSVCGRLLATAGQDKVLRIWVVKDAYNFFQDMRSKYNSEKVSPTPSQESLVSHNSIDDNNLAILEAMKCDNNKQIFVPKPFCTYTGHTSDLLDVSWSKNYFILSSSMDKTVRLWHISRKECLCCFQHIDFVTAIVFHPRDDRYFLSGSLDGKLRLWNIPDKKVAVWNEVEGSSRLITAANFCQNGKFAVVGSYDGRCIFYTTDQLKYHTQIHVRSTRGRNATGRKISGIEPMPGEDKILVTSNDSRIRLYDLRDLSLSCKYKGYVNVSSQIKASFSPDGKYIISGSENRDIYVWKTNHDYSKFSSVRRDRNDFWEAIKAHNEVVTCAIFAPNPEMILKMVEEHKNRETTNSEKIEDPMVEQRTKGCGGHVLISADFTGCIKIFINKTKPKHSSLPASALA